MASVDQALPIEPITWPGIGELHGSLRATGLGEDGIRYRIAPGRVLPRPMGVELFWPALRLNGALVHG